MMTSCEEERRVTQSWVNHIPNFLSISRIFLAISFPYVPPSIRLPMIVIALLTEFFDGYLARKLNAVTWTGQLLDPIADKTFMLAVVVVLVTEQRLSLFHLSLVAMRDIVVTIGTALVVLYEKEKSIPRLQPRVSGKMTTAFQFLLLIGFFATPDFVGPLITLTAVVSCASAADYLYLVMHRRFDCPPKAA